MGWGGIIASLALSHIRHATLLHVLLDSHAYVMLRYCTFSWTSTHTSCYATVRPLGLPRIRHATLLYVLLDFLCVLLDFHTYVMLRYRKSFKCNQRGHSTLHPSMPQYVFMWCWRSSLQNPDPKRFLEELETLL